MSRTLARPILLPALIIGAAIVFGFVGLGQVHASGPYVLFSDDMESGINGWSVTSSTASDVPWHQTTTLAASGATSWVHDSGGDTGGTLISPVIELDGQSSVTLTFNFYLAASASSDSSYVQFIDDQGVVSYGPSLAGYPTDQWVSVSADMSALAGHAVRVKFVHISPYNYVAPGLYVDDVSVSGSNPPATHFNRAPSAVAEISPNGPAGANFMFDGSQSFDIEGPIANYHWDFGDGNTVDSSTPMVLHAYAVPGHYTATLTVTDGGGLTSSATDTTVANDQVTIASATWKKSSKLLTIKASSTTPGGQATLSARMFDGTWHDIGNMIYNAGTNDYSLTYTTSSKTPTWVTVTSSNGGVASLQPTKQ